MDDIPETDEEFWDGAKINHPNEGLIALNEDSLKALCEMAEETSNSFKIDVQKLMTKERAEFVKELSTSGYTWRAIAATCYEAWNGDWFPYSNQLIGMALCEEAQKYFENDPDFNENYC